MTLVKQRDARWWFTLNGVLREGRVRGFLPAGGPTYVVTEFPKSGGTWLSQMLASLLGVDYPRNRLPGLAGAVMHGCYLRVSARHPTVVLWRDGRDIMVSYYFHLLFTKDITSARYTRKVMSQTGISDVEDIVANLPRFMEWVNASGYPGFTWPRFVRRWRGVPGVVEAKYEHLRENPAAEVGRIVQELTGSAPRDSDVIQACTRFSFEAQSGRAPGDEQRSDYLRKGIVGDWRTYFTQRACETFKQQFGDALIELGYERDHNWTVQTDSSSSV